MLYAVQFKFNSDRLEVKSSEIQIFSSIDSLIKYSEENKDLIREYDLYIDQPRKFKEDIAYHWIKKGNETGKRAEEIKEFIMNNNYNLPFPFIKINEFEEGCRIGKLKAAMIINNNIYYINGLEEGIYTKIIRKLT